MIDLDAYCARIGYDGPREATLESLRALHNLHPQAIPFENLDPLLKRPVKLDAASLQAKLVEGGRGGYCFEHNSLFAHVLRALGFKVQEATARVRWSVPPGVKTPSLGERERVLLLAHGRLQYDGKPAIEPRDVVAAARMIAPRNADADLGGALVGEMLVVGPARGVPGRTCQPQHARQFGEIL